MVSNDSSLPEVTATDSGFQLFSHFRELHSVAWDDVVEVVAFKRDVFSYDVICLGFRVIGTEQFIEVGEDFPGYATFLNVVESRFALAGNWWHSAAFPAFATNWSTIWASSVNG